MTDTTTLEDNIEFICEKLKTAAKAGNLNEIYRTAMFFASSIVQGTGMSEEDYLEASAVAFRAASAAFNDSHLDEKEERTVH